MTLCHILILSAASPSLLCSASATPSSCLAPHSSQCLLAQACQVPQSTSCLPDWQSHNLKGQSQLDSCSQALTGRSCMQEVTSLRAQSRAAWCASVWGTPSPAPRSPCPHLPPACAPCPHSTPYPSARPRTLLPITRPSMVPLEGLRGDPTRPPKCPTGALPREPAPSTPAGRSPRKCSREVPCPHSTAPSPQGQPTGVAGATGAPRGGGSCLSRAPSTWPRGPGVPSRTRPSPSSLACGAGWLPWLISRAGPWISPRSSSSSSSKTSIRGAWAAWGG